MRATNSNECKGFFRYCIAIFSCLIFTACDRSTNNKASHPEYFDNVFQEANRLNGINPSHSIAFLDSAFIAFPNAGIMDLYKKHAFKANYYIDVTRNNALSELYVDSMLWVIHAHISEVEYAHEYANALLQKAQLLMEKKDFTDAFECGYKARQAIELTNDTCLLSTYTYMLSAASYQQGKYHDAARYYIQGIKESSTCKFDYRIFKQTQGMLDNIGLAYLKCDMPDSALFYYNAALNYIAHYRDSFPGVLTSHIFCEMAEGVVYGNIGDVYLKKGDTVTAEEMFKKDININSQQGYDPGDAQCTQLKIVNLYLTRKKLANADQELEQLKRSLDAFPNQDNQLKWYQLKLDYLDMAGMNASAYQYVKRYIKLKDSIAGIKPIPQVDLREEYEHAKDQYNLVLLEKKDEVKNGYLTIVLIFSVLALCGAALLWYNWDRSRRLNARVSKQNKEMQLTLKSLNESQQENTQMMQIVAHDLKNPIASMVSITSLLLDNEDLPADDREMLELMQESSKHAYNMIDDLLNINIAAEGLAKELVDMHSFLRYCADLLQYKASEKGQHISLVSDDATLIINREKMWRVMSNLIVNAIKFSEKGTNIEITGTRDQNEFVIAIRDHGIGIPDSIKYRIFTMFTNAKRPGTAGERSFGMGLAISRQIIESHGGKIWFDSEEGKGTTFFVDLPIS